MEILMSPAISLTDLTWCLPDGSPLIANIHLAFTACRTGLVGRNGVGKTSLLKLITGELRPRSGLVSVRGHLGLLRQTVQIRPGETVADIFGVTFALAQLRRAEIGDVSLDDLPDIDWSLEARILSSLSRVGLDTPPETLLDELSGGQRTRARLAAVLFTEPDFLLLDEPTNNLDRAGRDAVISFLAKWRSGAIIVSHDRELLDTMDVIVELTSLGATSYGGNWTHYRAQKSAELTAAHRDLAHAEKRLAELARDTQATAERKAHKDAAGRRQAARGGLPRILLGGRRDHSEATSGAMARLAERRHAEAEQVARSARERIEILQPFSMCLPLTGLPSGRLVLTIDRVTVGYRPGYPIIRDFSLTITGPERLALTGSNGSGKTTLLHLITGKLTPWSGTTRLCPDHVFLDQQVSLLDPILSIRENFLRMNPTAREQSCRASLARFMFRADAALQPVGTLSGGQLLRAGLACVLGGEHPPSLLILDEPTNHLDLDSIHTVEAGLRAYDGALFVVSHDEAFLSAIHISARRHLPAS
jgi:ATPase subunit of ABC transporter with duplicated ATPase domains